MTECCLFRNFGLYCNDRFVKPPRLPLDVSNTIAVWEPAALFETHPGAKFGLTWTAGKTLDEVCPESFKEDWSTVNSKVKAHFISALSCKPDSRIPLYEFVPEGILKDFAHLKHLITENAIATMEPPGNYDFMKELGFLIDDISYRPLNFAGKQEKFIHYGAYNTKTGRLNTLKNSFPVLGFRKDKRHLLKPQNDFYVSLDFNGGDLRAFLFLSEQEQPQVDIHNWNQENLFPRLTRAEAKKAIFAWLYDPTRTNKAAEQIYRRDFVVDKYWNEDQTVMNPFKRLLTGVEKSVALSYTIQSTMSDMFLERAIAIRKRLKGKASYIAMLIQDELVLDMSKKDIQDLPSLIKEFQETKLGHIPVNVTVYKGDFKETARQMYVA